MFTETTTVEFETLIDNCTRREKRFLNTLNLEPGETVSKTDLMLIIWGDTIGRELSLIEFICDLRKKVNRYAPSLTIQNVRGIGYRLVEAIGERVI